MRLAAGPQLSNLEGPALRASRCGYRGGGLLLKPEVTLDARHGLDDFLHYLRPGSALDLSDELGASLLHLLDA